MVRRRTTGPKATLAGVMSATSITKLRPSMAAYNAERTPPCSFGRWDLSIVVETRAGYEKAVRRGGCKEPDRSEIKGRIEMRSANSNVGTVRGDEITTLLRIG